MDLNESESLALSAFSDREDMAPIVVSLFKKLRTDKEKRFAHGRYIEPGTVLRGDGHYSPKFDREDRSAIFISFPYFHFGLRDSKVPDEGSSLHPMRSLFQTFYLFESTETRDLDQACRKYFQSLKDSVLFVPQVWILIMGSGIVPSALAYPRLLGMERLMFRFLIVVITFAQASLSDLLGCSVARIQTNAVSTNGPSLIRVIDQWQRLFFFPVSRCKTLYELQETISQECLKSTRLCAEDINLCFANRASISGERWLTSLGRTKAVFITVYVRLRKPNRLSEPRAHQTAPAKIKVARKSIRFVDAPSKSVITNPSTSRQPGAIQGAPFFTPLSERRSTLYSRGDDGKSQSTHHDVHTVRSNETSTFHNLKSPNLDTEEDTSCDSESQHSASDRSKSTTGVRQMVKRQNGSATTDLKVTEAPKSSTHQTPVFSAENSDEATSRAERLIRRGVVVNDPALFDMAVEPAVYRTNDRASQLCAPDGGIKFVQDPVYLCKMRDIDAVMNPMGPAKHPEQGGSIALEPKEKSAQKTTPVPALQLRFPPLLLWTSSGAQLKEKKGSYPLSSTTLDEEVDPLPDILLAIDGRLRTEQERRSGKIYRRSLESDLERLEHRLEFIMSLYRTRIFRGFDAPQGTSTTDRHDTLTPTSRNTGNTSSVNATKSRMRTPQSTDGRDQAVSTDEGQHLGDTINSTVRDYSSSAIEGLARLTNPTASSDSTALPQHDTASRTNTTQGQLGGEGSISVSGLKIAHNQSSVPADSRTTFEERPGRADSNDGDHDQFCKLGFPNDLSEWLQMRPLCSSFVDLVSVAMELLGCYVPVQYQHITTKKYWGALDRIAEIICEPTRNPTFTESTRPGLSNNSTHEGPWIVRDISSNHELLTSAKLERAQGISGCSRCGLGKAYQTYEEAVEHLRKKHFPTGAAVNENSAPMPKESFRYWIRTVDQLRQELENHEMLNLLRACLRHAETIHNKVRTIRAGVTSSESTVSAVYELPSALVNSCEWIVKLMIWTSESIANVRKVFRKWEYKERQVKLEIIAQELSLSKDRLNGLGDATMELLGRAEKDILLMVRTDSKMNHVSCAAIGPELLIAAVLKNLITRPLHHELDILDLYRSYSSKLVRILQPLILKASDPHLLIVYSQKLQATRHPRKRLLRDINNLEEELDIVSNVYTAQKVVLLNYTAVLDSKSFRVTSYTRFLLFSFEWDFLEKAMRLMHLRYQEFCDLSRRIVHMSFRVKQDIEIQEENHGKAILLFTIVTVVFLPLSFVASFLGMNTSDIRNIDRNQSLFWSIALPLTTAIVFLALVVAMKGDLLREKLIDRWSSMEERRLAKGPRRLGFKESKVWEQMPRAVPRRRKREVLRSNTDDTFE